MSTIEELERRKKELELKRDIAKLERNERIGVESMLQKAGVSSWLWIAPVTLLATYFLLLGFVDGKGIALVVGILCFVPLVAKMIGRK